MINLVGHTANFFIGKKTSESRAIKRLFENKTMVEEIQKQAKEYANEIN